MSYLEEFVAISSKTGVLPGTAKETWTGVLPDLSFTQSVLLKHPHHVPMCPRAAHCLSPQTPPFPRMLGLPFPPVVFLTFLLDLWTSSGSGFSIPGAYSILITLGLWSGPGNGTVLDQYWAGARWVLGKVVALPMKTEVHTAPALSLLPWIHSRESSVVCWIYNVPVFLILCVNNVSEPGQRQFLSKCPHTGVPHLTSIGWQFHDSPKTSYKKESTVEPALPAHHVVWTLCFPPLLRHHH